MNLKHEKLTALIKADAPSEGTLDERRARIVELAQAIIAEAKGDDREHTEDEVKSLELAAAKVTELDHTRTAAKRSTDVAAKFAGYTLDHNGNRVISAGHSTAKGHIDLHGVGRKAATAAVAGRMEKAIGTPGMTVTDVPIGNGVYDLKRVATSALDVIPSIQRGAVYAYLRQATRENNAAVVQTGALKPTSKMGLTRVESRLKVVAHLSDPVDKFWLEDGPSLNQFVANELVGGLGESLERIVVGGTEAVNGMTGLLNVGGVQLIEYAVDRTTSIRKAITALETIGQTPDVVLLSPSDWEAIELARRSDGQFDAGSALPVERAAQKMWGLQVATSTALPLGTGLVFDRDALAVGIGGAFEVKWSENVSDDFSRNQLRCRVETRANLDVFQPFGIAKVALTAA